MSIGRRPVNVLLTSVGRRVDLVVFFRSALVGRGLVIACDSDPDAPALEFADIGLVAPPAGSRRSLDFLLTTCQERRVTILVPSLEPELSQLSMAKQRFEAVGTTVVVSSPAVVALCQDKLKTARFLRHLGIPSPTSYLDPEDAVHGLDIGILQLPLIVKPRWGTTSLGVEVVHERDELDEAFGLVRRRLAHHAYPGIDSPDARHAVLIQQKMEGEELGLDIVNDLAGNHVCTFARAKLRMRAGQTDRAVTVQDAPLDALGELVGSALRHVGLLDCDVIDTGDELCVLDLNPRIGGGYPFAHIAGADYPSALVAWAMGEQPPPEVFVMEPGRVIGKIDVHVPVPLVDDPDRPATARRHPGRWVATPVPEIPVPTRDE